MTKQTPPVLSQQTADILAVLAKGTVGAIPLAGPILSEIVGSVIPNQRLDRVTRFLQELNQRLTSVELEQLKHNQYAIDLFEDSTVLASKSLSENRNRFIAQFMKSSIFVDSSKYELKRKLLFILQELTDRDIEILISIRDRGYQGAAAENYPGHLTYGAFDRLSDTEKLEYNSNQEIWPLQVAILERHGLLRAQRATFDPDISPQDQLDPETGMRRIYSYEISSLGSLFLASVVDGRDG